MVVLVQSGTVVSVQRCTRGSGAGTRCNFQESAADVGNSRVCPLAPVPPQGLIAAAAAAASL